MDAATAPLPVGIENFEELVEKGYYYVDKTLLIKELLDVKAKVTLFTRPRRFGKTLSQSMIQTFFEREYAGDGSVVDKAPYFAGKKIAAAGEEYLAHLGRYPVISLSLKDAGQPAYEDAHAALLALIRGEFDRHRSVLGRLSAGDAARYEGLLNGTVPEREYAASLKFLSQALCAAEGRRAFILIDEYDVPLEAAWRNGYYDRMAAFIRTLLSSALKTNNALEYGVITGCLRISRESIFTGLNNLKTVSILNDDYGEYFGFLQEEVDAMLARYGLADKREEVKDWYDGYRFGNKEVYNPWSIINYVLERWRGSRDKPPKPYWANTSSNAIVRDLLRDAGEDDREELEALMRGGTIEKGVHEEITYGDLRQSRDSLWNFLLFTGYLRPAGQRMEGSQLRMALRIPNREIRSIYEASVQQWFEESAAADRGALFAALARGDADAVGDIISGHLEESISYMDYTEAFYHGFLVGLLRGMPGYRVRSNREAGLGRYDVLLAPRSPRNPGIILEFKAARAYRDAAALCAAALEQIDRMHYADELEEEGCTGVIKYGLCFFKKSCTARSAPACAAGDSAL